LDDIECAAAILADPGRRSQEFGNALTTLTIQALESPGDIRPKTVSSCELILEDQESAEVHIRQALLLLAAILYHREDLIGDRSVSSLVRLLKKSPPDTPILGLAGGVLNSLTASPVAGCALEAVLTAFAEPNHHTQSYKTLLAFLEQAATWSRSLLKPETLVSLIELSHLSGWRESMIERLIEPCMLSAPAAVTVPLLECLVRRKNRKYTSKYFMYYISHREDFSPEVRRFAAASITGHFDLHGLVRKHLAGNDSRALVIQNIKDGQGDEIVRCVPLIQSLLDFNPQLAVTLVTGRAYLYAHRRLTTMPITDPASIEQVLGTRFDALVDFFEPNVPEVNHDVGLEQKIRRYIEEKRPFLVLASLKGFNHFVYERVDLGNRPYAQKIGMTQQRVDNIYETTFRLAAELGLPLRSGEQAPAAGPVLAGLPWPDADAEWAELTRRNTGACPVALVNPFGGMEPLKGYVSRRFESLARQIRGLIEEGFYAVLLPNGTPWGSAGLAREVVSLLRPDEQAQVSTAPDPAGEISPRMHTAGALAYADHVMRLVTYFVRFADLVVTVEGWMMHAAYCLGRRYRVLMLPYSHPSEWHPYARTANQDVVQAFSRPVGEGKQEDTKAPPLPEQPRKQVLLLALRELASCADLRVLPLLRKALACEDRDVRFAAAVSMGRLPDPEVAPELANLLEDSSGRVRATAAGALLERGGASASYIEGVRREHLLAHQWIGQPCREWGKIIGLGKEARPALEVALKDDDPVVRREAAKMLKFIDAMHAARASAPPPEKRITPGWRRWMTRRD